MRVVKVGLKFVGGLFALMIAGLLVVVAFATFYDYDQLKPVIAQAVKDATGRDLSIAGDIDLALSLNAMPALSVTKVSFSNAPWGRDHPLVSVARVDAKIDFSALLHGRIKVDRLDIDGLSVFLQTDLKGRGNWTFSAPGPSLSGAKSANISSFGGLPVIPAIRNVRLRDVRVSFLDGATGVDRKFFLPKVDVSAERFAAPIFAAVDVTYKGVAMKIRGEFASLKALTGGGGAMFPVRLGITLPGFDAKMKAKVKTSPAGMAVRARLDVAATNVTALNKIMDTNLPDLQPLKGRVTLSGSGVRYVFSDLFVQVGDSTVTGKGDVDFSAARPRVNADLKAPLLDLDALSAKRRSTLATRKKIKNASAVFSSAPLPWALLRSADGDVKISARRIKVAALVITHARARAKLSAGRLDIKMVRFALGGGRVSAAISLDAAGAMPSLKVRARVVKLDVGRVLKMRGLGNILVLPVNVRLKIASHGVSMKRLMEEVDGSLQAAARNGRIDSQAFSGLTAGAVSILPWAARKDAGTISCMVADWRIVSGVATARTVLMDTPGFRVAVTGNANLGAEQLHLNVLPRAKTLSLASFAVPVRLKGSFAAPYVDVNPADVVVGTVKNVANAPVNIVSDLLRAVGKSGDENASCLAALSGRKTGLEARRTKSAPPAHSRGFNPVRDLGNGLSKAFKDIFGR